MSEPGTGRWLELRVHGVSGTPIEDLLALPGSPATPDTRERLDDQKHPGEFWRRRIGVAEPRELQAYRWAEYTSQFGWQALWVLLLPFGVINTAQFMLPLPGNPVQKLLHALAGLCLRVIGLALSLLAFLSMACITMDLIGWYGVGRQSGRCYVATALLAAFLACVLGWVGLISWQRDDGRRPGVDPEGSVSGLHRVRFYTGVVRSPDARRLHSAAILAMSAP